MNGGKGAWAFDPLAEKLASYLNIEISDRPRLYNYLLNLEEGTEVDFNVFIPMDSVRLASDKRLLAQVFNDHKVPTPLTILCEDYVEVLSTIRGNPEREWCLKFPTSCGASGHRVVSASSAEPPNWPTPFVLQEFIKLENPAVFRTYCAGSELFGWVARQFPDGAKPSAWVSHARGARYVTLGEPPEEASRAAELALKATGLWHSFGCVDLLHAPDGEWLVLEVGTDGLYNHVDRDLDDPALEERLHSQIAKAFWKAVAPKK